jgi:hypothetical protein
LPGLLKSTDRLVKSTALNSLQFDVWVFGIAYLNIGLFEMALTQFSLHVLHICGLGPSRTTTKLMAAYFKVFVAYLKAYVFSKFSDWQSMKSMAVSSMECVSTLTRSTWALHDASGTANWRPALPEFPCVSKMMIASLESFLGV